MKIDGRCHCGYITYQAEIDPEKVMICHCTDCQTLSGSAFRTVAFTLVLPGMRNADLFDHRWRRTEGPRHPCGHRPPTRSTRAESATLVSLLAELAE
jgi:hypothetical protein